MLTAEEHLLISIIDAEQVNQAMKLMNDIVEQSHHLYSDWIAKNKWVAVPVESGGHFQVREAEWFSKAATSVDCKECLAIATEKLINTTLCYLVRTSQEGFMAINQACAGLNYVLVPKNHSFAILLTTEDYYIVAGSKEFVEQSVGSSILTARKMFFNYSNDSQWPLNIRERLLKVARRYEFYDGANYRTKV